MQAIHEQRPGHGDSCKDLEAEPQLSDPKMECGKATAEASQPPPPSSLTQDPVTRADKPSAEQSHRSQSSFAKPSPAVPSNLDAEKPAAPRSQPCAEDLNIEKTLVMSSPVSSVRLPVPVQSQQGNPSALDSSQSLQKMSSFLNLRVLCVGYCKCKSSVDRKENVEVQKFCESQAVIYL